MNSCQHCKTFENFKHHMGKCYNKLYDEKVFTVTFREFARYYHDVISSRHVTFNDHQKNIILKYAQARVCIIYYVLFVMYYGSILKKSVRPQQHFHTWSFLFVLFSVLFVHVVYVGCLYNYPFLFITVLYIALFDLFQLSQISICNSYKSS